MIIHYRHCLLYTSILSAVMHADEINRAMTEALGREVYHYHLHVVYVPVVRCV